MQCTCMDCAHFWLHEIDTIVVLLGLRTFLVQWQPCIDANKFQWSFTYCTLAGAWNDVIERDPTWLMNFLSLWPPSGLPRPWPGDRGVQSHQSLTKNMDHSEVIDENTSESFHQNLMEEEITLLESPESLPASNLQLIQKTGSSGTESFKVKVWSHKLSCNQ